MPIDKYLCDFKPPVFLPGPSYVKIKVDLKRAIFDKKLLGHMHIIYTTAIVCLLALCSIFILKPQTAHNINTLVFGQDNADHNALLFADKDVDLSQFTTQFKTISSDASQSLPFIEDNKSYLIQRVKNSEDQSFFYVREVKKTNTISNIY